MITAQRLAREVRKPITPECKNLHHPGLSASSATNLDGTLKPLLSVVGQFGSQETPKSTTFVRKRHHFDPKDRKLQRDRHSNQGSIVRTSVVKPQFGHPFFIWPTLILNPINTTENQPILPIKRGKAAHFRKFKGSSLTGVHS